MKFSNSAVKATELFSKKDFLYSVDCYTKMQQISYIMNSCMYNNEKSNQNSYV